MMNYAGVATGDLPKFSENNFTMVRPPYFFKTKISQVVVDKADADSTWDAGSFQVNPDIFAKKMNYH
jgi:hypothetical protein